jgi:hypothetical protein
MPCFMCSSSSRMTAASVSRWVLQYVLTWPDGVPVHLSPRQDGRHGHHPTQQGGGAAKGPGQRHGRPARSSSSGLARLTLSSWLGTCKASV